MTIKKDNYEGRVNELGQGLEDTVGVPQDGMQDPTGEYPKRDYNFGSSLNTASRGITINELDIGGGYPLDLGIKEQRPSEFPFNQVQETPSGHVIEMDDTPAENVFLSNIERVRVLKYVQTVQLLLHLNKIRLK